MQEQNTQYINSIKNTVTQSSWFSDGLENFIYTTPIVVGAGVMLGGISLTSVAIGIEISLGIAILMTSEVQLTSFDNIRGIAALGPIIVGIEGVLSGYGIGFTLAEAARSIILSVGIQLVISSAPFILENFYYSGLAFEATQIVHDLYMDYVKVNIATYRKSAFNNAQQNYFSSDILTLILEFAGSFNDPTIIDETIVSDIACKVRQLKIISQVIIAMSMVLKYVYSSDVIERNSTTNSHSHDEGHDGGIECQQNYDEIVVQNSIIGKVNEIEECQF